MKLTNNKKTKSSKLDRLIKLNGDAEESKSPLSKVKERGKISLLCSAIWVMAEHTRYELDAKDIIMSIYPYFFTNEDYRDDEKK